MLSTSSTKAYVIVLVSMNEQIHTEILFNRLSEGKFVQEAAERGYVNFSYSGDIIPSKDGRNRGQNPHATVVAVRLQSMDLTELCKINQTYGIRYSQILDAPPSPPLR
jgi:hypothetical protein